jgi:hypothetical protein
MITEWKPVDFADKTASPYLLILAFLLWLGLEKSSTRFPWTLLTLALTMLALRGRKLLPEFTLAALAVMSFKISAAPRKYLRLALCAAALLALGVTGWVSWGRAGPRPFRDWERGYPLAAVDIINARYPGRRIFHDYDWGGYLIYKLYPRNLVFIDGRLDPYWSLLAGDYAAMLTARPGWGKLLDEYGITVALLKPTDQLCAQLIQDPKWQTAYADARSVLLARR